MTLLVDLLCGNGKYRYLRTVVFPKAPVEVCIRGFICWRRENRSFHWWSFRCKEEICPVAYLDQSLLRARVSAIPARSLRQAAMLVLSGDKMFQSQYIVQERSRPAILHGYGSAKKVMKVRLASPHLPSKAGNPLRLRW